jgi:pimeloyl-ACP methyl ester carboxylesterase
VEDRRILARDSVLLAPSAYGEPIPITRLLLEEGEGHLLLRRPIALDCPVHLLHGQLDPDIPWQTALRLAAAIAGGAVTVELIKDGDHRLSRDDDLRRIAAAVDRVLQRPDPHG